jgi:hypothetical protein
MSGNYQKTVFWDTVILLFLRGNIYKILNNNDLVFFKQVFFGFFKANKMNELLEMIKIVNKQKVKNINVLTQTSKIGKLSELYEGIHSGSFQTDEQAMAALYNGETNAKESYRKLKDRLTEQLINSLFFIGHSEGFGELQRLTYQSLKLSTAAKITRLQGLINSSVFLGKRALKMAIRLEQAETIVSLAIILRGIASRQGDLAEFEKYNSLYVEHNQILQEENLAKMYLEHVSTLLSRSNNSTKLIPILNQYATELKNIKRVNPSADFIAMSHLLYVNRCEVTHDHELLQEVCEQAIELLEKKDLVNQGLIFVFLSKSTDTYIRFQQWEKGSSAIQRCIGFINTPYTFNWIHIKYKYLRLCFFCDKIEEGFEEFSKVEAVNVVGGLMPAERERWEICRGYFKWFKIVGRLKGISEGEKNDSFRINKFINQLPLTAKDKEGYNAAVLVLQLLFLIQMKKNEELIDKAESSKVYIYRYLRNKQMSRTHSFVNLLLLIPANQFNKIAVIRKSTSWLNRLKANPLKDTSLAMNVEIVPYETLWNQVLNLLDEGFIKPKKKL